MGARRIGPLIFVGGSGEVGEESQTKQNRHHSFLDIHTTVKKIYRCITRYISGILHMYIP